MAGYTYKMSTILTSFHERITHTFGPHSFNWFSRAYVIDWYVIDCYLSRSNDSQNCRLLSSLAWFIAWLIKELPPFEREFTLDDPLISHKHHKNQ